MHSELNSTSPRSGRKILKWIGRIAGAILAVLLLVAIIAVSRELLTRREDAKRFPQQGRKVDVGGYSLNLKLHWRRQANSDPRKRVEHARG
jgi:hypothetical protein